MSNLPKRKKYFTKHLFRAGLQCPAKLYYYARQYPQNRDIRPFIEHAGYNKRQLKALLRGRYPDGIKISEANYEEAFEKTQSFLRASENILFDAVFIHQRRVAKIPALVKDKQHLQLYFVQTKIFNPNKHRLLNHHGKLYKKWKQYIYDAAFQIDIIRQLYPYWQIEPFLLLPDKTAAANNDKLYNYFQSSESALKEEELFFKIDIGKHVEAVFNGKETTALPGGNSFSKTLELLTKRYFKAEWEAVNVGMKCKGCEFRISERQLRDGQESGFNNCWNQAGSVPEFSESAAHVFELLGPGVKDWINEGIYLQKNISLNDLPSLESVTDSSNAFTHKQRQTLQVMQAKGQEVPEEIIKPTIFKEIDRWQYPLHFLDFEAGNYAVPIRKSRRPYHLVVFQYSCHTLHKDGSLNHTQWIAKQTGRYPNYDLVRQLIKVSQLTEGTIIQYSNFERTALKIIRKELLNETEEIPDVEALVDWLDTIIQRNDSNHKGEPHLADLSRLVKNYYYNRFMADSLSIKDVVQSMLTVSKSLKKHYQIPYQGTNFDGIEWWQWDEKRDQAQNPYTILRALQPDIKVGRGTEAMVTFGKILSGSLKEIAKERALDALLQYCELDTLAMVMIYQHWQKLALNNKVNC